MAAYKTPGVYVEEIVKFPPSVAQVETAIPAFIGYTQKATKKEVGDLSGKPTRITSMLEYETFFGSAKEETAIGVSINDDGVISVTAPPADERSPFLMFYSLQMYFANGGGPCYIVSVGQYDDTLSVDDKSTSVSLDDLEAGLAAIRKEDEPTLLLFPDATSLPSDADFYAVYKGALTQCKELQDRFTIIDTFSDEEHETTLSDDTMTPDDSIREGINVDKDYLKYGAVYYPFLETILDYSYDESSIEVQGLSSEGISSVATRVFNGLDTSDLEDLLTSLKELNDNITDAADNDAALLFKSTAETLLDNIISNLEAKASSINEVVSDSLDLDADNSDYDDVRAAADTLNTWMDDNLEADIASLHGKVFKLGQDDTKAKLLNTLKNASSVANILGLDTDTIADSTILTDIDGLKTDPDGLLFALKADIDALADGGASLPTLESLRTEDNETYNKIKIEIGQLPIKLPPSSAMAGVYARVDSDRGVWKAPANVGVNYVIKPSQIVTHEEQQDLNVDTVAGKSINAIRSFTGKGVLVWGARTLTGNDNEWRYISVRRFFNMAEESIKKATEQFVFEPNDKNTWVRVKAMITNFLTAQWRAGALAGPTPEKAFYVNIGLGETMTAIDILEGNMIVEIGMAVVRPAEFIILKFSHKMQEA
jgi:phage tail sheath protein FI